MYLKLTNVHKDTCIERYGGTLYNINVSIDVPVLTVTLYSIAHTTKYKGECRC